MPAVARLGDVTTGHSCFPPRPSTSASGDVFVNGIGVVRVGDSYAVHKCGKQSHGGTQSVGSPTVFVNGQPLARIGDDISCNDAVGQGSENVFSG